MLLRRTSRAHPAPSPRGVRRGFTLIELLVVVALASLLVSIMLPGLARARDAARAVRCSAQARGLAVATFAFGSEHRAMPLADEHGPVEDVASDVLAWRCPSDARMLAWQEGSSYAYRGIAGAFAQVDWTRPGAIRADAAWRTFEDDPTLPLYKECGGPYGHATISYLAGNVRQQRTR